jgi:hypothetical protein
MTHLKGIGFKGVRQAEYVNQAHEEKWERFNAKTDWPCQK